MSQASPRASENCLTPEAPRVYTTRDAVGLPPGSFPIDLGHVGAGVGTLSLVGFLVLAVFDYMLAGFGLLLMLPIGAALFNSVVEPATDIDPEARRLYDDQLGQALLSEGDRLMRRRATLRRQYASPLYNKWALSGYWYSHVGASRDLAARQGQRLKELESATPVACAS